MEVTLLRSRSDFLARASFHPCQRMPTYSFMVGTAAMVEALAAAAVSGTSSRAVPQVRIVALLPLLRERAASAIPRPGALRPLFDGPQPPLRAGVGYEALQRGALLLSGCAAVRRQRMQLLPRHVHHVAQEP